MSTNDAKIASRPMQMPKVGWGDDDADNDDGAGSTKLELELPSLSNNTGGDGVTQRTASARNLLDGLAPIPEDYSMHEVWPDYYYYFSDSDSDIHSHMHMEPGSGRSKSSSCPILQPYFDQSKDTAASSRVYSE